PATTRTAQWAGDVALPSPSRATPNSTATIGSTTVRHATTTSGGPDAKACWMSQPPARMAATTPAREVRTAGSKMPIWPDVTACEAARTSADTSPNAPAPAMAHATQRAQPVRASPTPASTSTTRPTTTPASSMARPGAGVLTAEPAAVPTNVTTAVTQTMTPTTIPDVGLRCVRAAASTTAIGTASTPTGCTTDRGASTNAIACSVEPPAASPSPSCHPGLREISRSPRSERVPEPRSG